MADELLEDPCYGFSWYLSTNEIENNSPSRKDGVDQKMESYLRMLYCSFLQDIGMKLKMPQVTIATAMVFCHRFYLRQSHAKNEWQTVATVCMFLASKVEDTPCPLEKVVVVAYERMYKKDPDAAKRIFQKDIFEKQKALILIGERLLLSTIRFDFNIQHPYQPLREACKKFLYDRKDVKRAAWHLVNNWLRSTLCVQYKPHYIAAGSLYLAAKFHHVKLPSERGSVWWHAFEVAPRQLNGVIQHMSELLGFKNKSAVKPSQPPLAVKKEAISSQTTLAVKEEAKLSSPDCILTRVDSSSSMPSSESGRDLCGSKTVDSSDHNNTSSSKKDDGNPTSAVADCKKPGEGEPDWATDWIGEIDRDRIRAMFRRRKREREGCKKAQHTDNSRDECWIERELESGIELGPSEKRQRLA